MNTHISIYACFHIYIFTYIHRSVYSHKMKTQQNQHHSKSSQISIHGQNKNNDDRSSCHNIRTYIYCTYVMLLSVFHFCNPYFEFILPEAETS